jgi:NADH dehydrogenase/NADH:ubiquinone oxidoreductase subunit G
MTHVSVPYRTRTHRVDASHERFVLDHNRCVLCTRCVRVCDEVEGAHTWDLLGRGVDTRVITDLNQPWGTSHHVHQLRKVRARLSDRRAVRKGQVRAGDVGRN